MTEASASVCLLLATALAVQNYAARCLLIEYFTVVCPVTWPLHGSEARVDLVLIQTSLLLLCKTSCSDAN